MYRPIALFLLLCHLAVAQTLREGDALLPKTYLESPNGVFRLLVQEDGNCGVYQMVGDQLQSNWETGTSDKGSLLKLSRTGLLEVIGPSQRSLWHSSYQGMIGFYRLRLRDDGDLIVEQQLGNDWRFCWSSLQGSEGHYLPSPGIRLDRVRSSSWPRGFGYPPRGNGP